MTMTDPIADMLTRIRNANIAMHDEVSMPASKLKESLAALLYQEGYIGSFSTADNVDAPGRTLTINRHGLSPGSSGSPSPDSGSTPHPRRSLGSTAASV